MTTFPEVTDTQALTALRRDLKEILRIDALDCDGATTDALLVRAAADSMAALNDARASADKHAFDAMRADIRVAELGMLGPRHPAPALFVLAWVRDEFVKTT